MSEFSFDAKIQKLDEERQLCFGWFSVVEDSNGVVEDHEGDIIKSEDLEEAAYQFVIDARIAGENHLRKGVGVLVESMMFTKEKQEMLGIDLQKVGWWGGFKITDEDVWAKVKSGEFQSFSIGGRGDREEI